MTFSVMCHEQFVGIDAPRNHLENPLHVPVERPLSVVGESAGGQIDSPPVASVGTPFIV